MNVCLVFWDSSSSHGSRKFPSVELHGSASTVMNPAHKRRAESMPATIPESDVHVEIERGSDVGASGAAEEFEERRSQHVM